MATIRLWQQYSLGIIQLWQQYSCYMYLCLLMYSIVYSFNGQSSGVTMSSHYFESLFLFAARRYIVGFI